jgi:hypothetical protein
MVPLLNEQEEHQLKKFQLRVSSIFDKQYEDYVTKLKIKLDITPHVERLAFFKTELVEVQNKFLLYDSDLLNLIHSFIREYVNFYKYVVREEPCEDFIYDRLKDFYLVWFDDFIKLFALSQYDNDDKLIYLEYDYGSVDENMDILIDENKNFDLIPLPNFEKLMDCILTFNRFMEMYDYYHKALDDKYDEIEHRSLNVRRIKQNKISGFESSLSTIQIKNLFNSLKGKYIEQSTTPEHFKAIFSNEKLPDGFKPIKLHKNFSAALCAYFISELFQKENPNDYWSIGERCFDVKTLRQSYNNFYKTNKSQKPKGYNLIDDIIKNLYNPLQ